MAEPAIGQLERSPQTTIPDIESGQLPIEERCLTEVDNLNRHRLPDGTHAQWVLDDVFDNLVAIVKEGGIPNAVSRTEHFYQSTGEHDEAGREAKAYMWLGRTAIQHAESGRRYHRHPAALERVEVEVEEARDAEANLRPGITKVFISPRMSPADAPYKVAKAEHLGDDDSIRCSQALTDEQGNIHKRAVESALVRDVPLEAWVSMLADRDNVFGKSVQIDNPESALSVMKTHRELEAPSELLPDGVISMIEAVIPYIADESAKRAVEDQAKRFREDQAALNAKAVNIAGRLREFEVALADSLHEGQATLPIRSFIISLQNHWNEQDLRTIRSHQQSDGHFRMSRELAIIVEEAKQKMLLVRASVVTGNERVIKQLDAETTQQIYRDEMVVQTAYASGYNQEILALEAGLDRQIAGQKKIKVGGGCIGDNDKEFGSSTVTSYDTKDSYEAQNNDDPEDQGSTRGERKVGKTKRARCETKACPTRPREVKVGGCGFCLQHCQKLFDAGIDPTKLEDAKRPADRMLAAAHQAVRVSTHESGLPA